ncbi:MAG TPA: DnaJ domain-containing protein [Verrucomicrobiae bacterium]|nr:DnaJ domain-containing protein [Verrucomicrobiae bacterium]
MTRRRHIRNPIDIAVTVYWEDSGAQVHSAQFRACNSSEGGMMLKGDEAIPQGTHVFLETQGGNPTEALVSYCLRDGARSRIGVQFTTMAQAAAPAYASELDYYEVLQLNPKADPETIHRVFRIMAARFHPDNPQSGNQEKFLLLSEAYRVLGDPEKRAQYDAMRGTNRQRPMPLFQAKAFVDDKEGEANRRLGVLCLLYAQRRRDAEHPNISLLELEEMMSFPREYLEFTLWYLRKKGYVEITEGADYSLTAAGVDFVEEHATSQTVFVRLLQHAGATTGTTGPYYGGASEAARVQ